jgi:hypothetical protein
LFPAAGGHAGIHHSSRNDIGLLSGRDGVQIEFFEHFIPPQAQDLGQSRASETKLIGPPEDLPFWML